MVRTYPTGNLKLLGNRLSEKGLLAVAMWTKDSSGGSIIVPLQRCSLTGAWSGQLHCLWPLIEGAEINSFFSDCFVWQWVLAVFLAKVTLSWPGLGSQVLYILSPCVGPFTGTAVVRRFSVHSRIRVGRMLGCTGDAPAKYNS